MQPWAESLYKSAAWKSIRAAAWKRDGGLCVDCAKAGRITPAEEVHHITELTPQNVHRPEVALNLSNLVSLCRECHKARHGSRGERRYIVDDSGNVFFK